MPNKTYTSYAARTGRIIGILSLPDIEEHYDLHHSLLFNGVVDGETYYIVDGQPVLRPVQQTAVDKTAVTADGEDVATITGIPEGAKVTVQGPADYDPAVVTGGVATFAAVVPGSYTITVERFPCLPWVVAIDAA